MKLTKKWQSILGCTTLLIFTCLASVPFLLIVARIGYPPAEMLASEYLNKVQQSDLRGAADTGGLDSWCRNIMEEDAKQDIAEFGGADIRGVNIKKSGGGGSDDGINIVTIRFSYRKTGQTWQEGEIRLMSNINDTFRRYNCGNLEYHGP